MFLTCVTDELISDSSDHNEQKDHKEQSVKIPVSIYNDYAIYNTSYEPLYLALECNNKIFVVSNIESLNNVTNYSHGLQIISIPPSIIAFFDAIPFETQINERLIQPSSISKCSKIKLKGSRSSYSLWPCLKSILIKGLKFYYVLNVGQIVHIIDINFTITSIMAENFQNSQNFQSVQSTQYASIFNRDIEIKFDVPYDIEEKERLAMEEQDRIKAELEAKKLGGIYIPSDSVRDLRAKNMM